MTTLLDDLLARINGMEPGQRQKLTQEVMQATAHLKFIPNAGPQTQAYFCPADILLFGGQGGGGKSTLLAGLALTQHKRSLIMRRQYTDLGAMIEEAIKLNGTRDGFNGSAPPKLRTTDGRLVEFGACKSLGDEQSWQGQPHDLLGLDEAVQFLEMQVRFLMGWVRSTDEGQRKRVVLASNPPVTASGQWIIGMFRPWLDLTHHKPAKPGELRYFVTAPDGRDLEVDNGQPVELDGKTLIPTTRTFIPAGLRDNPFLVRTNYQATLDALPEPLRSAVRDGNFMAARQDAPNQVIPTAWVLEAQQRWTPNPPHGVPMTAMGVDVAQGGPDETVIAIRHDGWYAPCVAVPGVKTPYGKDVAGIIIANRRNDATVVIDLGGGYGGAAYEHLKSNDENFPVIGYKGAEKSTRRTRDRKLSFTNKRTQEIWRFREALDPSQPGGSPIALPDDPMLLADLTAATFEVGPRGIQAESKQDVCDRLGRSTDRGDAVIMAWSSGTKDSLDLVGALMTAEQATRDRQKMPEVVMGHMAARRAIGR